MSTVVEYPNWFKQTAQHNFEHFLTPLAGVYNLKFLQLGTYTGDASVWLCENVLFGESSYLIDVDTWRGSDEIAHETINFESVYNHYLYRTSDYEDEGKVVIQRMTTTQYLLSQYNTDEPLGEYFDFIYIDADHTTVGALLDAELSWPLLKSGGIMSFDDYTWNHESGDPRLAPTVGIDLFIHRHQLELEVLVKNTQVWIRKK